MAARKLLVADLLCGAGGSTTGCERALLRLGWSLEQIEFVVVNHWQTAIDTMLLNHPRARHYVQDIATGRPHLMVPEGYLDLLMASPTCTHHSNARGGKPTSDQQRSDPWHIITWLTELRVKRIIIENVWEFIGWGPIDRRTGRPILSRKGEYFWAWINAIKSLGFELEWRKLNAADYGDATTRQRFILMGRSDGKKIYFPAATHARQRPGADLFPTLKPWRPAREIIDWELKGKSIFTRDKDLAPKTLERIMAGAIKYNWPPGFIVTLRNHMVAQGLDVPLPAILAQGTHIGLAQVVGTMKAGTETRSMDDPLHSPTTQASLFTAEPMIVNLKGQSTTTPQDEPLPTITAHAGHLYQAEPIILSQFNSGEAKSVDEPLGTITTGGAGAENHPGCARPMLAEPFIANVAHGNSEGDRTANERRVQSTEEPLGTVGASGGTFGIAEPFVVNGRKNNQPLGVDSEPIPTLDTKGGVWVAQPFVLSQGSGGAPRSVEEPIPTIVTGGQQGSGTALISPYYGSGSGETCSSADEVLPTVTSKGRFGVVVPVTNSNGGPGPRSTEDPLATMTTAKGGEFAIVMPVTHHDGSDRVRDTSEPLPTVTGANRSELAFITAQHGERPTQAPRTHSVDDPTPTIAASGHTDLIQGVEIDGVRYDILFRMLEPHELAAAMGFDTESQRYTFAGNKTEKIKQIGNAVSVAKMTACVGAIMSDATPKRAAKAARKEAA